MVVTDAGNDLVLLSRSMTFPNHSTEKMCAIGSFVRRYCCEGNDVLSAKERPTALSERPVRGTIACVSLVNETQKTLKVNKMDGFNKYPLPEIWDKMAVARAH